MRRLALISIAAGAIALLGALAGCGSAVALSSTQRLASAAPCAGHGVATQGMVHHAGLVIMFPKGRVETACIEFGGESVTGTELLQQSGLPIVFAGFGGLGSGVCRIDDVGCSDPGDCFCQCRGGTCAYWQYFRLQNDAWTYSSLGPSQRRLHDGDVDGWVWGAGHTGPGDLRGPCPVTPTLTSTPPIVAPAPSNGEPSGGGQITAPGAPTVARPESALEPRTPAATAVPLSTPVRRVVAQRPDSEVSGNESSKRDPGGGAPWGLIAFGVVAGVLVAGLGGVVLRRRLGG